MQQLMEITGTFNDFIFKCAVIQTLLFYSSVVVTILESEKWQQALQYCYLADAMKQPPYYFPNFINCVTPCKCAFS